MSDALNVAAAIPAYQADLWVADVVSRTRLLLEEVLVVSDGSTGESVRPITSQCTTWPMISR